MNYLTWVMQDIHDEKVQIRVFEVLLKYGFDIELLTNEEFSKFKEHHHLYYQRQENELKKQNIAGLQAFGTVHNKNAERPLSIAKAQATMQVMYKDVTKYLPSDLGDFGSN